jgi:DNA-binding MarR family transcriptional regulator
MPNQSLSLPTLNIKKGFQIISSSVLILVTGILFFQGLSSNIKPELPLTKQKGLLGFLSTFFVILLIIITFSVIIARHYRSKHKNLYYSNTNTLFQLNEVEFLKVVRNKIVIGLENIQSNTVLEFQDINLLTNPSTPKTTLDFFPSEIKQELQTKIRNNTIFTLIEIAYQDPTETNPTKLSKSLNIPPSTLSREIKKLLSLNYLETYFSDVVMFDTRLKNFKITEKGFFFLMNLKNALNIAIAHLKERNN